MLTLDACVLDHVISQAESLPAGWSTAIEAIACKMTRNRRRISQLPGNALEIRYTRLGPYIATPESCNCKVFRRCRMCEHRLMAWLHQQYCEALNAQPVSDETK